MKTSGGLFKRGTMKIENFLTLPSSKKFSRNMNYRCGREKGDYKNN
jgi:hypothetical protein